ncbi:MAG: purine-nucleoside phosphorylase [Bacteroidetes bacterium]|nr:purine-nucleoside phosphorylase [Bacteroidota bacterium]
MSETDNYEASVNESVNFIKNITNAEPKIAIILGSGLNDFAETLSEKTIIDYKNIPNFPIPKVAGHGGKIYFGKINNDNNFSESLLVFQGRNHFYESGDLKKTTYSIELAAKLGIKYLIITNAAGGINSNFIPGDLMLINDFINLTFENPLIGKRNLKNISNKYFSNDLIQLANNIAIKNKLKLQEGVYCWTKGPTYETAAEINMMRILGADAVGMSTIPEVIVAKNYAMEILGISCITNLATGSSTTKLDHKEVTFVANQVKEKFSLLMKNILLSIKI